MGCGGSKYEEEEELVKLCRERKQLLKSAGEHRFALAAAHAAYFRQLTVVGDKLWRFVEEELVLLSSSSSSSISSLSSPVITIPSHDFSSSSSSKKNTSTNTNTNNKNNNNNKKKTNSRKIGGNLEEEEEEEEEEVVEEEKSHNSHLHWSSSGENEEEDEDEDGRNRGKKAEKERKGESPRPGITYIPDHELRDQWNSYGFANNNNNNYSSNDDAGVNSYYSYPEYNYEYNTSSYGFGTNNRTSYGSYYMRKSSTRIPTVIYEEPKYVNNPVYAFSDSQGFTTSSNYENVGSRREGDGEERRKVVPPTPPSPKVSAWDYFNPFESFEDGGVGGAFYGGVQPMGMYGYGNGNGNGNGDESNSSTPDSREVREREGIPDLEEETETEVSFPMSGTNKVAPQKGGKSVHFQDHVHEIPVTKKGKKISNVRNTGAASSSGGGSSFDEGGSRRMPFVEQELELELEAVDEEREVEDSSSLSPETDASVVTLSTSGEEHEHEHEHGHGHGHGHEHEHGHNHEDVYVKKKGVSFEVEGGAASSHDVQSSMPSSLTTLSADGTRDLREVVREIKDEFEAATDYGKEVSTLLEVGREPYRSRSTFLRVMLAKVCSTSLPLSDSPSGLPAGYPEGDLDSRSLASTLDKLYVWEKKLYKEIKDEEKLRLMYEKQCKKLKTLDEQGAESSKIEATEFSIRKLLTQIKVSVRAVDSISSRIHKLRDEELQPQLKELIYGMRKMWKLMLKCHQKQFQAILESKTRALRANTGLRKDSSVRATIQLEAELLKWCQRFNNWIEMQRSYAETLNSWLERCIQYEPEVTSDGVMPFSPGRIGAPPVFVICHDWKQAMERVSESQVQTAMNDFATSLHQLWERQDEEQRRRLKAENMYKDFERQIRVIRVDRQRKGRDHDDAFSDKNSLSIVASDNGISPLDDLKVDLDSMRQRVREERAGHKEAVKLVHDAVSRSIQAGLIPIFESLESFTSEASKALDDVRLEHVSVAS
ncbi:hypothetical protein vseg_005328 [Gypsophila vaccaria]